MKLKMVKKTPTKKIVKLGTIRIKAKDLKPYKKTSRGWVKTKIDTNDLLKVVKLFKAHKNFNILIDTKNPDFIKGQLSKEGNIQGARINILPNGEKIDKAYSLFAKHLTVHDQSSDDHWDVIFQNKGGTFAYCYTLEKKQLHKTKKFKKVHKFDKVYSILSKKVTNALRNKKDHLAMPMYTLLKTKMRIGNEIYYKAHRHKGLTTLKKRDITIKGDIVKFNYLAKDGVPRLIEQKFPTPYILRLKDMMKKKKIDEFIFTMPNSLHPMPEQQFKKAFKEYCGQEFYPHIVRSHYATKEVKDFLKGKRKVSKEDMQNLFLSIAHDLGHKKFVKKENQWKDSYSVTVNHYIQPEIVEMIKSRVRR
jgi:hypothetical protein